MSEQSPRRNPFKVVVVIGVPGVGKTTVLKHLSELASSAGVKLKIVNFGDYMLSKALELKIVGNRDELRRLPLRRQLELQAFAAQEIIEEARRELDADSVLLIDTHALIRTPRGYLPGLPRHVVEKLSPDAIVLIEADPEEVLARQQRDKTRYRADFGGVEGIRMLMEHARISAFSSATLTASIVAIVNNREGSPEEAARSILQILEGL
ncbi:MAG: adenylate kinase [Acidilobaceae archaeon]